MTDSIEVLIVTYMGNIFILTLSQSYVRAHTVQSTIQDVGTSDTQSRLPNVGAYIPMMQYKSHIASSSVTTQSNGHSYVIS